jgi:fluoroquinolone resistance protein
MPRLQTVVGSRDQLLRERLTGDLKAGERISGTVFEECVFTGCTWDEAHLSSCQFLNCTFSNCSVSLTGFRNSTFAECRWVDCKLLSVDWTAIHCNPLPPIPMAFEGCKLSYSSFVLADVRRWSFTRCDLVDTDFSDAQLVDAKMLNCNLESARFVHADMRRLDLTDSYNYLFDVRDNRVNGLKVSATEGVHLLRAFGIELTDWADGRVLP